jgi:hypothetical protein
MDMQTRETGRGAVITPRVVFGLFLLTLGVLFLLDQAHVIDIDDYWGYWPVFLIAYGLAKVFQPEGRGFGFVLLVVGSWALLDKLGVLEFDWAYVWPAALILMGLSLVWRGVRGGLGRGSDAGKDPGTRMSAFAMLGGVDRKYTSPEFRGGDATAVMGGCELDFRQATPAREGAVVDAFALWGGIDIQVPEDSRKSMQPNPAKVLVIKGVAIMGGVEVKS